jgi:hypothetical protein
VNITMYHQFNNNFKKWYEEKFQINSEFKEEASQQIPQKSKDHKGLIWKLHFKKLE